MSKKKLSRRTFVEKTSAAALGLTLPLAPRELLLYVGTYTREKSEGIYVYRMNPANGELKKLSTAKAVNPSFLAIDPRRRFLYAVGEVNEFGGKPGGVVTAFAIDQRTGALQQLNQQSSVGGGPCYVTVDPGGKFALVANYGGGSVATLPIKQDGSLAEAADFIQHTGTGATKRQDKPHAHCIVLDAAGRHAFVADLGLDKVMNYRLDVQKGKLTPAAQPFAATKPGAGPRHFTFHPAGKFAYVINELDSTITAFTYDKRRAALQELQTTTTLPADFKGESFCADVHVHPSGKFLYGSNRGHDSIVAFTIDKRTGKLTYLAHEPTQGKWPRNFAIDPSGKYLLVANQNTNSVVTFAIDHGSGKLQATGQVTEIPLPVCLKFIPAFS